MTAALNDELAREVIRQSLLVQRFEAGVRKTALMELVRLDRVLVGLIAQSGGSGGRLKNLLALAKEEINKHLDDAKKAALAQEEALIAAEARGTVQAINVVTGAELATAPASQAFNAAVQSKALVMGAPASQWWSRQKPRMYNAFADTVRAGVLTGRTTRQITSDWTARSGQFRRHAEAQVRTGVQSILNATRSEIYQRNADVVKGQQALATLDLRTSALCRGRSGMAWDLEGRPMNDRTTHTYPGPPPWHWNCRSIFVPVLKSFSELDPSDQRKIPEGTRASMDGEVPEDITYNDWFKGRSEAQQIEVLGKTKHDLWKKGKLSMRDMVDQSGRPLTIDQLEAKIAGGS